MSIAHYLLFFTDRAVDLWREETTLEQFWWQDSGPRAGPMLEQTLSEGGHPMEGTQAGAGEEHEEASP